MSDLQLELAAISRACRGDRIQLQQVLLNLVLNGADAMRIGQRRGRGRSASRRLSVTAM